MLNVAVNQKELFIWN